MYRPTWVEISTRAFSSNLRQLKLLAGPGVAVMAVLKADAYGHGGKPLAKRAVEDGASLIGVSSLEEGIALRECGIEAPILLLGGIYPLENFAVAIENNLTPTVSSLDAVKSLGEIASARKIKVSFHLKVDTGMGRIGVSPIGAKTIFSWLSGQPQLNLAGVYSHFACADSDPTVTQDQLRDFLSVRELATGFGFKNTKFHIANSAAAIRYPESRLDLIRPGIALYGVPTVSVAEDIHLQPVLSWHSRIVFLKKVPSGTPISYGASFRTKRESVIATLPVGYADGIPRLASNKGFVLIKGRRCPIVGRVTMDHIMVDVTDIPVDIGEIVTLIGRQSDAVISASEWGAWADTISYEIFCGISKRVPRIVTQ